MDTTIVKIAGTSSGGSSYTLRMIRGLNADHTKDLMVVIGKGAAQQAVYESVMNQVIELLLFVNRHNGSIKQNIEVVRE